MPAPILVPGGLAASRRARAPRLGGGWESRRLDVVLAAGAILALLAALALLVGRLVG